MQHMHCVQSVEGKSRDPKPSTYQDPDRTKMGARPRPRSAPRAHASECTVLVHALWHLYQYVGVNIRQSGHVRTT